ncbi:MAG TPA: hypothetical protein P5274_02240 [Candidatus Paceibacterota bacterium]|nr:hypothetical protein [Candidatus Paceibacterota bacterium]
MYNQKDNNIKDFSLPVNPVRWARYVSLKGRKLTQAIYLVTSLLPDSEPLKWRLRDISLDILSDVSMLQSSDDLIVGSVTTESNSQLSPLFKVTVLEAAVTKIDQLISWLDVALAGNFSSDLNLVLVRQEYSDFNKLLKDKVKTTGLNKLVHLGEEDLLPPNPPVTRLTLEETNKTPGASSRDMSYKSDNGTIGHKEKSNVSYQKLSHLPHKSRDVAKDSRRSLIISFLKGKDWTSIKDISEAIVGCSSKTIQRELSDLVQQGVLKKKGDRRWSRYLLAS